MGRSLTEKRDCQGRSARVQVFGRRSDELSTRSSGRRLKSAKARNRGRWGTVGAAGARRRFRC
jgi:hypothetical protein